MRVALRVACWTARDGFGAKPSPGGRPAAKGPLATGSAAASPCGRQASCTEGGHAVGPWRVELCALASARPVRQPGADQVRGVHFSFMSADTPLAGSYTANDVPSFVGVVRHIRERAAWFKGVRQWGPWFRGQRKAGQHLTPKLYRSLDFNRVRAEDVEDEMREEFIKRAPVFCENLPAGDDKRAEWEWYFMMQHFGVATRLLDWTEGALIALYFAVRPSGGEEDAPSEDAAVWVLDPYRLNKRPGVLGREWIMPPSASGVEDDKWLKRVQRWLPTRFKKMAGLPGPAVAIEPTHVARRISSQHSCFTIHGRDVLALDKLQEEENGCLVKIIIPADRIDEIRIDLRICGINEATIFPDLDGVGRSINARWDIGARPPPMRGGRPR